MGQRTLPSHPCVSLLAAFVINGCAWTCPVVTGAREAPRPSQSRQSHPLWLRQWLTCWVVPGAGVHPRRNMCQSLSISEAGWKSRVSLPGFQQRDGVGPHPATFQGEGPQKSAVRNSNPVLKSKLVQKLVEASLSPCESPFK